MWKGLGIFPPSKDSLKNMAVQIEQNQTFQVDFGFSISPSLDSTDEQEPDVPSITLDLDSKYQCTFHNKSIVFVEISIDGSEDILKKKCIQVSKCPAIFVFVPGLFDPEAITFNKKKKCSVSKYENYYMYLIVVSNNDKIQSMENFDKAYLELSRDMPFKGFLDDFAEPSLFKSTDPDIPEAAKIIEERNRRKFRIGHLAFRTHHSENINNLELKMNSIDFKLRASIELQRGLISKLAKENRILARENRILARENRILRDALKVLVTNESPDKDSRMKI
jgi:hypothetical protein